MNFNPEHCRNESEVESKFLVQYLLPALGYSPDSWFQEVALGQIRLDFMAFAARVLPKGMLGAAPVRLILEAKHPNRTLDPHVAKLRSYVTSLEATYGLLTNGKEVRVYQWRDREFSLIFQCPGSDVAQHMPALSALIGRHERVNEDLTSSSESTVAPPVATPSPAPVRPADGTASSPARKDVRMHTIAIYHNKGGVGKTTTVVNLAAALAEKGLRILIVDLDAQANTTFATGLVRFEDELDDDLRDRNVAHVLQSEESFPIAEVARPSRYSRGTIDVLPSHISLMQHEQDLNMIESSRIMLAMKLRQLEDRYDLVLIDTPPSLNLFARIALIAADHLIIPSDLKPFANQGLVNVLSFIGKTNEFRRYIGKSALNVLGVLPTKISTHARFVQHSLPRRRQAVLERYGVRLMAATIFEREDLAKCTEQSQLLGDQEIPTPMSVLDYKSDSPSAEEFRTLAGEVLEAIAMTRVEAVR